jgi:CRP-like cAMP-binding protein
MKSPIKNHLSDLEAFKFLEPQDYRVIEEYMFMHEYEVGSYVCKEGGYGGYMFFIIEGEVEIIKQFDNQKHVIATLSEGMSVGEMSLIDSRPRSATVRASTPLKLIVLKREDFLKLNKMEPTLANKVLMGIATLLSQNLRDINDKFTEKLLSIY